MVLQRVGHYWATSTFTFKWKPRSVPNSRGANLRVLATFPSFFVPLPHSTSWAHIPNKILSPRPCLRVYFGKTSIFQPSLLLLRSQKFILRAVGQFLSSAMTWSCFHFSKITLAALWKVDRRGKSGGRHSAQRGGIVTKMGAEDRSPKNPIPWRLSRGIREGEEDKGVCALWRQGESSSQRSQWPQEILRVIIMLQD